MSKLQVSELRWELDRTLLQRNLMTVQLNGLIALRPKPVYDLGSHTLSTDRSPAASLP